MVTPSQVTVSHHTFWAEGVDHAARAPGGKSSEGTRVRGVVGLLPTDRREISLR